MTLKGGLQQMTERLAAQVEKYRIFVRRRVLAVEFAPGGPGGAADSCSRRFQITCEGGKSFDADAVILAVPAYLAGGLVSSLDHRLSELLEGIPYSSSMTVSLGFDEQRPGHAPRRFWIPGATQRAAAHAGLHVRTRQVRPPRAGRESHAAMLPGRGA